MNIVSITKSINYIKLNNYYSRSCVQIIQKHNVHCDVIPVTWYQIILFIMYNVNEGPNNDNYYYALSEVNICITIINY